MKKNQLGLVAICALVFFCSCGVPHQLNRSAQQTLYTQPALRLAHVGISIYDPLAKKYWYNHQGDKYFVPASNTKIPTCYAAMKYLGDSILSAYVLDSVNSVDSTRTLYVRPVGDPTFLLAEFPSQPLLKRMQESKNGVVLDISTQHAFSAYGSGWSWDDFQEAYLAERSVLPIYGNVVSFYTQQNRFKAIPSLVMRPPYMNETMMQVLGKGGKFQVNRQQDQNVFSLTSAAKPFTRATIPFKTLYGTTSFAFLKDTLERLGVSCSMLLQSNVPTGNPLYSVATDSLLKPLMHRSDNFFAEQSLLMVSQRILGKMNDEAVIDTLLKTDFADLPQRPRWADGSGLSRYNLFTPQCFVRILEKMKNEFGMERIKTIFPTGGEGTFTGYYKNEAGAIYAKTGTLSGVVSLSGYLYTRKGKLLLFSALVNNHQSSASEIRRLVEQFIIGVREKY
jgi:D-alanyl-D-alanine carboxypeptidase/D-alanyl-D-alanine-endopeptidase (penicillin-binding protein 4)